MKLKIVGREGNYEGTRRASEMIFTIVNKENRLKEKGVIDIVDYRGGDMVTEWLFNGITQGLGLGLEAVAAIGAGIAGLWTLVGIYLGRWFERDNSNLKNSKT